MGELNSGIFQVGPDISGGEAQKACLEQLRKIALDTGHDAGEPRIAQGDLPDDQQRPAFADHLEGGCDGARPTRQVGQ